MFENFAVWRALHVNIYTNNSFIKKQTREIMSDLKKYITKRKNRDIDFAINFDEGYTEFKLSEALKQLRHQAGVTQEDLASRLHIQKTAISRIENHADDMLLSTLFKIASALGKRVDIHFVDAV